MTVQPKTFRIFSPDELRSNKLDQVFAKTTRNMQWDPETANKGGRVSEMLSEHTLQGGSAASVSHFRMSGCRVSTATWGLFSLC